MVEAAPKRDEGNRGSYNGGGKGGSIALEKLVEQSEVAGGVTLGGNEYSWELDYHKSWQHVHTSQEGHLIADMTNANKLRYKPKEEEHVVGLTAEGTVSRRCIIRNIVVVVDCSKSSLLSDYKPYRLNVYTSKLDNAINDLLEVTPLASVAVVATSNRKAQVVQGFSTDRSEFKQTMKSILQGDEHLGIGGHASLYSALLLSMDLLESHSIHGSREIYVCVMSTSTVDPRPVGELIPRLKSLNIVCSSISLTPEMYAVSSFCKETGGDYHVVMDVAQLDTVLGKVKELPRWTKDSNPYLVQAAMVEVTFLTTVAMCMCHDFAILKAVTCPRCAAVHCQTPIKCVLCGLLLLQDYDMQRLTLTYNVLPKYEDMFFEKRQLCDGCQSAMGDTDQGNQCSICDKIFCKICFKLIEHQLKYCPCCAKNDIIQSREKACA